MLKSMRSAAARRRGGPFVWLFLMGLVAAAVSTIRGPQGLSMAQEPGNVAPASANSAPGEYLTKYVPADADFVLALRPGEIAAHPVGKAIEIWGSHVGKELGFDLKKVEQVVVGGQLPLTPAQQDIVVVVKYTEADKLQSLFPKDRPAGSVGAIALFEAPTQGEVWGSPDPYTIVIGPAAKVAKSLATERGSPLVEGKEWETIKSSAVAARLNPEAVRAIVKYEAPAGAAPTPRSMLRNQLLGFSLAAPIWQDTNSLSLQVQFDASVKATLRTESATAKQAQEVAETVTALGTLARNWLRTEVESNKGLAPVQIILGELARDTLAGLNSKSEGTSTVATLALADKNKGGDKIAELMPSLVDAAREAAQRQESVNNLKQIALALHNYHDTYGHFPPAVVLGPDGKTPHSWRVAILPFMDHDALYRQYKFDEPWDSENNKKVLAQVPRPYQDPSEKGKSTNASYFAIVGKNTILDLGPKGAMMSQIVDGLSNTMMVVEAKKEIPWSKPEDLSVETPAAALGYPADSFLAALGDGSVKSIPKTIDAAMLKWLFLRDDGNVVTIP